MKTEDFYREILDQIQDGVYYVDVNRKILYWNQGAQKITGYTAEEIVGKNCQTSGLSHIDLEGRPLCSLGCPLFASIADGRQRNEQVFVRHKDGYRIPIMVKVVPIQKNGEIMGAVEIFTRNSPKVYEDTLVDRLTAAAMQDSLTGLPNRRQTEAFLDYKMQEFHRFGRAFAVLYADIDDFSKVNNTYGHDVGDEVLKNVSLSLKSSVRRGDMIGRWGGEELVGIYSVDRKEECRILAERFRSLVEHTQIKKNGVTVCTTISVGVTMVRPEYTCETVVERADKLLYQSKADGKDRVTEEE